MKRKKRIFVAAILALTLAGCRQKQSSNAAGAPVKQYSVRGTVMSVDTTRGEVVLDHEAVAGFMPAMTMEYALKQPEVAGELHAGDRITATLEAVQGADVKLDHIVVIAQARPDTLPQRQYHVPQAGDAVPDYPLLNQNGKTVRLGDWKGKVVVLTFIYTRCPLAEFCPKMSRNFAEIDKALHADPALYAKTHLLSVSFDPEYDTPAVLKSYGGAYTGRYTAETFAHWDFAAPRAKDLEKMEEFFDLGVTPGENKTLNHSLATVIVGEDGKVAAFYPTNDWTVDDVLAKVKAAAK